MHLLILFMSVLLLISEPSLGDDCFSEQCANINTASQWQAYIKEQGSFASKIMDIHSLREKRDLPNSMARLTPPNNLEKLLYTKIASLKKSNNCIRRKVLSCLFLQNYDESLSRTAIETSLRLSDKIIYKWVKKLPQKQQKDKHTIIEDISENMQMNPTRQ